MKLRLHHANVCSDDIGLEVLPPLPMIELADEICSEPEERGEWKRRQHHLRRAFRFPLAIHERALSFFASRFRRMAAT